MVLSNLLDSRFKTNGDDTELLSMSPGQFLCNLDSIKNLKKLSNSGVI